MIEVDLTNDCKGSFLSAKQKPSKPLFEVTSHIRDVRGSLIWGTLGTALRAPGAGREGFSSGLVDKYKRKINVLGPFEGKPTWSGLSLGEETCPLPLLLHPAPHLALSQGTIECFQKTDLQGVQRYRKP